MTNVWRWFDDRREVGLFFIRLIIGFHLVYGTADNVFSHARMIEFRGFLESQGTPFPLAGAYLSAWSQFICGILFIIGLAVRPAAIIMIINFIAAVLIAHRTGGYPPAALALIMLFCSIGFLFHGAGAWSVDSRRAGTAPGSNHQ